MSRLVTIGNGNLLVGIDERGQVRDLYYPFVGEANHVSGASGNYVHRIGVYVDEKISWFDEPDWNITVKGEENTCIGSVFADNPKLGISITSRDAVHNEQNIFLRHFVVHNHQSKARIVKLFLSQQFRIFESRRGDTGFYDPRVQAVIHYKGDATFLINAKVGKEGFHQYNIGLFGIEGREGTYMDAVDGILEQNPIEHGSVDSVIGLTFAIPAEASCDAYYWIVCAKSVTEAHTLDENVLEENPERLIASTASYWKAWLEKEQTDLSLLPDNLQRLYRQSLIVMRVHADNRGGIIASSDTDMLHHGRDTYSYVWPRDAAMISHAFDVSGYRSVALSSYKFLTGLIEPSGYLMHKYRTDGVLGSSWHPWIINGNPNLPIQEDETASVLFMLWKHYELYHDIEFIESIYNTFIEPATDFIAKYIEPETGLPQASFDLWEERYGTSTYTSASVFGGLMAGAKFANLLGKIEASRTYQAIAQRLQTAISTILYDDKEGMFVRQVHHLPDGVLVSDHTLDMSSFYGPLLFEVCDVDDVQISRMLKVVEERLAVGGASEGFMRYEGDQYYRRDHTASPNPWIITTLWVARYYIEKAKTLEELNHPLGLLNWVVSHANSGYMLAEQMAPDTRKQLSTTPLVWSHAEYVLAVQAYMEKIKDLNTKD